MQTITAEKSLWKVPSGLQITTWQTFLLCNTLMLSRTPQLWIPVIIRGTLMKISTIGPRASTRILTLHLNIKIKLRITCRIFWETATISVTMLALTQTKITWTCRLSESTLSIRLITVGCRPFRHRTKNSIMISTTLSRPILLWFLRQNLLKFLIWSLPIRGTTAISTIKYIRPHCLRFESTCN